MDQDDNNREEIDLTRTSNDSSSRVQFEDEPISTQTSYFKPPKIIQWVIKYSGGYVKDEKQASYVILGFVALAIVVSLFLLFSGGSNKPTSGTIPRDQFVPGF